MKKLQVDRSQSPLNHRLLFSPNSVPSSPLTSHHSHDGGSHSELRCHSVCGHAPQLSPPHGHAHPDAPLRHHPPRGLPKPLFQRHGRHRQHPGGEIWWLSFVRLRNHLCIFRYMLCQYMVFDCRSTPCCHVHHRTGRLKILPHVFVVCLVSDFVFCEPVTFGVFK